MLYFCLNVFERVFLSCSLSRVTYTTFLQKAKENPWDVQISSKRRYGKYFLSQKHQGGSNVLVVERRRMKACCGNQICFVYPVFPLLNWWFLQRDSSML